MGAVDAGLKLLAVAFADVPAESTLPAGRPHPGRRRGRFPLRRIDSQALWYAGEAMLSELITSSSAELANGHAVSGFAQPGSAGNSNQRCVAVGMTPLFGQP